MNLKDQKRHIYILPKRLTSKLTDKQIEIGLIKKRYSIQMETKSSQGVNTHIRQNRYKKSITKDK